MYKQLIIDTCKKEGLLRNQAAYVLGTTEWETNKTFEPVREAYWLSETWRKTNLRYWPWYGRGFVQLTWEENYIKASKILGVDLTTNPDRAMDPAISARILVVGMRDGWFTGKKLSQYITLKKSDFKGARPIVNGDSSKRVNNERIDDIIARLARKWDGLLLADGYGVDGPRKPTDGSKPSTGGSPTTNKPKGLLELLIEFIVKLFGGKR